MLMSSLSGFAQKQEKSDQIEIDFAKALFVERFCKFIEWPNQQSNEFVIAYIGTHDSFYAQLKKVFKNNSVKDRPIKLVLISDLDTINKFNVNLLILGDDPFINLNEVNRYSKSKSILTISHKDGYCMKGVIINFFIENDRLRFEINDKNLKQAGLTASYHLLRLAKIINPTTSQKNEN